MKARQRRTSMKGFFADRSGETTLPIAVLFAFAVAFAAVLSVPFLDEASREYAENKAYGVDRITTSSVGSTQKPNRYILRRSIFDKGLKKICKSGSNGNC